MSVVGVVVIGCFVALFARLWYLQVMEAPQLEQLATTNRTGEAPNEVFKEMALASGWRPYPAYIGLGFLLRGEAICHHQFGTLATPRAFGNYGAGSTLFWVDPELDMSFVCLTTKLIAEPANIERFQRLSDIAISAAYGGAK